MIVGICSLAHTQDNMKQDLPDNIIKKSQLSNCRRWRNDKDKHAVTLFSSLGALHLLDGTTKRNKHTRKLLEVGAEQEILAS